MRLLLGKLLFFFAFILAVKIQNIALFNSSGNIMLKQILAFKTLY